MMCAMMMCSWKGLEREIHVLSGKLYWTIVIYRLWSRNEWGLEE
jgi:hypothetical protein